MLFPIMVLLPVLLGNSLKIRHHIKRKEMLSPGVGHTDDALSPNSVASFISCPSDCSVWNGERYHNRVLKKAFLLIPPLKRDSLSETVHCPQHSAGRLLRRAAVFTDGSLTVEASVVLPVFAACMAVILALGNVYKDAARMGSVLGETGQEMAIGAYAKEYTDSDSPLPVILSAGYASARLASRAGDLSGVRGKNLLLSSFMEKEDRIDLVLTYQMQSPSGLIRLPWIVFLQRASVRGWVGRKGSGSTGQEGDAEHDEHQTVYVTQYGTVYHTDPDCTHIHLSIRAVSTEQAQSSRNRYGGKYHVCEKCGGGSGGTVYITSDGNRYHGSLSCSGLKRSVREMTIDEAQDLRPCSKCACG